MSEEKKYPEIECRLCRKKYECPPAYHHGRKIDEWSKVCQPCHDMWELGKKAAKAARADGKDMEAMVPQTVPTNTKLGNVEGPTDIKGLDVIAAMGAVSLRGTEMGSRFGGSGERINIVSHQDERDWVYIAGQSLTIKVPKARAMAMQKIVTAFLNAIAKARVEGFNEGRNLLLGLAKGEVSLETYSEQADNSRVGKKPRKRWD
jgi:hypothetical protein